MRSARRSRGVTLVISLIMMVVLTVIVATAIRFGNINLRIAGNAQSEAEATAAAQVALELMLKEVKDADKPDLIEAKNVAISTGGASYTVALAKPVCLLTRNVRESELNPANAADKRCYGGADRGDVPLNPDGTPSDKIASCKDQIWDVQASVNDSANTGAKVTILQGTSMRVGAEVDCP